MLTDADDLATADRRRLDLLLRIGRDPDVREIDAVPLPVAVEAAWTVAFEDAAGVWAVVAWVADPEAREDAARHLVEVPGPTPTPPQVGTNGAMLLYAVATNQSDAAADRLLELSGRFAGNE